MSLSSFKRKRIELDELEKLFKIDTYCDLYVKVNELISENKIKPIISSGQNGKSPTLYKRYTIIDIKEDNKELIDEIEYKLISKFNIEYYRNHLEKYIDHRKYILQLNDFFINKSEFLNYPVSMNERAFQIWGREKFLQKEEGKSILKNLGIDLGMLNYYDTSEPLAYYSRSKNTPQNVLIIENKDTYYTLRNYLISNNKILGKEITTIIYGAGKNVWKAFKDFRVSVENHVSNKNNKFFYFGDLDYEGILIYEKFYHMFSEEYNIRPFIKGYEKMVEKSEMMEINLPKTKAGQNRNIENVFLQEFSEKLDGKILKILENNLYIPQEIINLTDL
ncbi:Wadjet anti-phage system protein JetD domain-containing protein [Clostridium perfringens]|uniref:Wadjet protein JetD C-terminal domain-containing protein n=1 Tax=Clostridium perfringens (strain SM101 / Type A) TaxID=289380 RepID=Q0SW17_CLOPS|nr:Wadjet anti-phage system protein JetD domain-containing protein [Clostridium perfringens]ABG86588.1 hypothetical protein CPR_0354 [Clostridium perfringens SM101]EJT5917023.1 hypothetical protein [Clostridium perfringens]EJT5925705.1 hypothetical protein [Clostridium perfringens]EJT6135695.1 hypothetical protein [Clostridium perfringens]MBP2860394.1 hypothetical protein [Clostridium perfringens]